MSFAEARIAGTEKWRQRLDRQRDRKKRLRRAPERLPSVESIKAAVAAHFDIGVSRIDGDERGAPIVRIRQMAHYLALTRTGHSYERIGRCFHRDHATILHSARRVKAMLENGQHDTAAHKAAIEAALEAAGKRARGSTPPRPGRPRRADA